MDSRLGLIFLSQRFIDLKVLRRSISGSQLEGRIIIGQSTILRSYRRRLLVQVLKELD